MNTLSAFLKYTAWSMVYVVVASLAFARFDLSVFSLRNYLGMVGSGVLFGAGLTILKRELG